MLFQIQVVYATALNSIAVPACHLRSHVRLKSLWLNRSIFWRSDYRWKPVFRNNGGHATRRWCWQVTSRTGDQHRRKFDGDSAYLTDLLELISFAAARWTGTLASKSQMKTTSTTLPDDREDPFDLDRFVSAQMKAYDIALSEVSAGQKRSHWMWYIFPQLRGLGHSSTSRLYGILSGDEAHAYLSHDVLGPRLIAVCEAALAVEGRSATEMFGKPDDMKLRSCATLFAHVSNADSVFHKILDKYFDGKSDRRTVQLLAEG